MASVVALTQPSVAASAAPPPLPSSRHGDEEIEVCGYGFVSQDKGVTFEMRRDGARAAVDAMQRVSDQLLGSAKAQETAVGHMLAMANARDSALLPELDRLERCGNDEACGAPIVAEASAASAKAGRVHVDALARLAADSAAPAAYAMAVQACATWDATKPHEGNCQLITLERWAQIEPGNAVPWLHLAAAADKRGDPAGKEEALYHASVARTDQLYGGNLLAIAEPALSKGLSDSERAQTGISILGLQAAWTFPSLGVPMKMCSADALLDSNRHQLCDAFASVLLDRSNTLIEYGIGVRLAERLHWSTDRLEALRRELAAMTLVATSDRQNPDDLDCASLKRLTDQALRTSRLGEVASARARIAASGRTVDALADENRRNMAALAARFRAESAAIAASAAASALPASAN